MGLSVQPTTQPATLIELLQINETGKPINSVAYIDGMPLGILGTLISENMHKHPGHSVEIIEVPEGFAKWIRLNGQEPPPSQHYSDIGKPKDVLEWAMPDYLKGRLEYIATSHRDGGRIAEGMSVRIKI